MAESTGGLLKSYTWSLMLGNRFNRSAAVAACVRALIKSMLPDLSGPIATEGPRLVVFNATCDEPEVVVELVSGVGAAMAAHGIMM